MTWQTVHEYIAADAFRPKNSSAVLYSAGFKCSQMHSPISLKSLEIKCSLDYFFGWKSEILAYIGKPCAVRKLYVIALVIWTAKKCQVWSSTKYQQKQCMILVGIVSVSFFLNVKACKCCWLTIIIIIRLIVIDIAPLTVSFCNWPANL